MSGRDGMIAWYMWKWTELVLALLTIYLFNDFHAEILSTERPGIRTTPPPLQTNTQLFTATRLGTDTTIAL